MLAEPSSPDVASTPVSRRRRDQHGEGDFCRLDGSVYVRKGVRPEVFYLRKASRACLVPEAGIEPARVLPRGILSPLRLPISPLRQRKAKPEIMAQWCP